jgi:hypothetical protein
MSELEHLIDSLLYEGYALYPYTPGATKNATPTPFGIVYPPAYAAALTSTHDHLDLRCVLAAGGDAELRPEVRFLASAGAGHEAVPMRIVMPAARLGALAAEPSARERSLPQGAGELTVAMRLTATELADGEHEISLRVENLTTCNPKATRGEALRWSLLSTHPLVRVSGGRFLSPLERPCASVNTYPVLATPDDDVVLGAAIVLPDHPEIAPESRGSLFDGTEIEEALVLHVQALSDAERAEIAAADPAVREMVERAAAVTPEGLAALHGRVTLRDPSPGRSPMTLVPPQEPPGLADPSAGQEEAEVDGVVFRRGASVRLRPGPDADLHARMLDGRLATVERIFVDYDGRVHLGVTIDDDPGRDLMRETNRFLFFFAPEVEVVEP